MDCSVIRKCCPCPVFSFRQFLKSICCDSVWQRFLLIRNFGIWKEVNLSSHHCLWKLQNIYAIFSNKIKTLNLHFNFSLFIISSFYLFFIYHLLKTKNSKHTIFYKCFNETRRFWLHNWNMLNCRRNYDVVWTANAYDQLYMVHKVFKVYILYVVKLLVVTIRTEATFCHSSVHYNVSSTGYNIGRHTKKRV